MNHLTLKIGGMEVLIDALDAQILVDYGWHLQISNSSRKWYVRGWEVKTGKKVLMHRLLTKPPRALVVDHINGNSLDNRRSNLRISTNAQNLWNRRAPRSNTSGFKGVAPSGRNKWVAYINVNNEKIHLGTFLTKEDAALAYNKAALEHHGQFAKVNVL